MTIKERVENWFIKKYDVDEERLQLIEHKGSDVIHFITQYIKDNEIGKQLGDMLSSLLVSKSRIRGRASFCIETPSLKQKDAEKLIERNIVQGLFDEFQKEKRIDIKKSIDKQLGQIIYEADVFMFDSDTLKDTIESYVKLMPEWKLKELKGWK
jgi:hypothetical protein